MPGRKTIAGAIATTTLMAGGLDTAMMNEVPLERIEMVANERIVARQVGNVVETTLPWKNATPIKVKYDMGNPTALERLRDKRNRQVITETVDIGDGGFKVDVILNEKPDTNRFCYQIEGWEDYDFFYQPALTQEEIDQGASRPEDIVGSYAVYHKTKRNHVIGQENYATGKVMHIPRPEVWEVNNPTTTREWADLSYRNGELCVTARQGFLDNAEYPVRIDPTFGYTSAGATLNSTGGTGASGPETAPEDGTITSMSIYGRSYTGTPSNSQGIYADNAGDPDTLIQNATDGTVSATDAWNTTNISASIASGTDYWLAFDAGVILYYSDSVAGYSRRAGTGTFPDPWVEFSSISSRRVSIYATYTASGGEEEATPRTFVPHIVY